MIGLPAGTRIWIAAGVTDLRRGFTGLSGMVQTALQENPFSGQVFVFRGRRGDLIKVLWFDGDGLCLFAKRLERGRFIWPQATNDRRTASNSRQDRFRRSWAPALAASGLAWGGLAHFADGKLVVYPDFHDDVGFGSLLQDRAGNIWFGRSEAGGALRTPICEALPQLTAKHA